MRAEAVLERRRAEQERLLAKARSFVAAVADRLQVRAAVVFGSVARGDFNESSDVDVLVIAEGLARGYWERLEAMGDPPPGVEPIVWTPEEWRHQGDRGNPIALEAARDGVWLVADANLSAR